MTNDDMQRKMEFIVEQQAQITVHIQQLEEERIRDRPRLARLEKSYERLEDSFQRLVALAEITDSRLDRLESSHDALEATMITFGTNIVVLETNMVTFETKMVARAEAQTRTDEKLRALIDIVRRDRNGA